MLWQVDIRPLRGWQGFVQPFTEAIISTIGRNLKVRLQEPGAYVTLAGPRGSGSDLGRVPKESWLGGVLAAHLADRRPVLEQTAAIFQPWAWGRSSDVPGDGDEWSRAEAHD